MMPIWIDVYIKLLIHVIDSVDNQLTQKTIV